MLSLARDQPLADFGDVLGGGPVGGLAVAPLDRLEDLTVAVERADWSVAALEVGRPRLVQQVHHDVEQAQDAAATVICWRY